MSKDTIYREDAIKAVDAFLGTDPIVERIKRLPSADRPQGEWIVHFDDLFPEESLIECSICHEEQPLGIDDNFCPYCGAKMKGADDETC